MSQENQRQSFDDPGAAFIDRVQGTWNQHGRNILIVVGALLVVGLGSYYMKNQNARKEEAAAKELIPANDLFWQGQYDRARASAKEVAKKYAGSPSGNDALRIAGDAAFWLSDAKDAVASYESYLKANGSGLVADGVRRSLAYAYENAGRAEDAAKMFDRVAGAFDRESNAEMLNSAGRCWLAANKPENAKKSWQRILDDFPDASYQLQARIELGRLSPTLAN